MELSAEGGQARYRPHSLFVGSAAAVTDILSGEVKLTIDNAVFYEPYIRDGRVRALATVATERTPC